MANKKNVEANYSVEIVESSMELNARARIILKDTSDANKLDVVIGEGQEIVFAPADYAILAIHNEKADDPDYKNYLIIDKDGNKYVTGSTSFWNSFKNIYDEMKADGEDYEVKIYKLPSKNYNGKSFITCSLV
jgi:hypothetical protein